MLQPSIPVILFYFILFSGIVMHRMATEPTLSLMPSPQIFKPALIAPALLSALLVLTSPVHPQLQLHHLGPCCSFAC